MKAARKPARAGTDDLPIEVLRRFREVFRAAKLHFARVKRTAGVSGAQLWALSEIHARPGIRVTELAQSMSLHQSTVSNLIEKLASSGHVQRLREAGDNRIVRLRLTSAGKKIVVRAPGPARGVLPDALERMDRRSLKQLSTALDALVGAMKVRAPSATKTHLEDI
ncbi:MAG TPA: MarR family transcriptional regulator [Burkholderiales bacterium]|nr:MarR family transcriptional regulator [Burkholderiales bacterium]